MITYIVAGGIALATALLGAWATDIGSWYRQLEKPPWQPPDWLFGPVWTAIFVLIAIALAWAWNAAGPADRVWRVALPFGVNLVLNVLWSVLFFRLRRPRLALLEVAALWLSIVWLVVTLWGSTSGAALLLLPYLVWVSFAAFLNRTIVRLNPAEG